MKIAAMLALALSASAQTYSHSGWNFADTLQTASDVVVADITGGRAVAGGSQATVKATLHAVRILRGNLNAGATLTLAWQYRLSPAEAPPVTTEVSLTRGLWFLHKNAEGALEPLQTGMMMGPMGGYFLPLGDGAPPSYDGEPLETKIAREIGTALEDLVAEHAADLGPYRPEPGGRWVSPSWTQPRMQYQALAMALQSLDQPAAAEVYQSLSTLPDPNLKTLGIFGRIGAGDISAVFDLEKNLPTVVSANNALHPFPLFLGRLDLRTNLAAAHALARIALSDTTIPILEDQLAFTLGRTGSPEMLPYLIVMLGSPQPGIRGGALMGFCQLLGPKPAPSALWKSEMAGYCPDHSPNIDPEVEQKDTQFWREWWKSNRVEIAKTVTLPDATPPARYDAAPPEKMALPMEMRFQLLVHMSAERLPDHYHAEDGSIVEGPPPVPAVPHDPISGQLDPEDREIFRQAIESANAKLAALQARGQQMLSAARMAGTRLDRQQLNAMGAEQQAAAKAGIEELQTRLSPEGWRVVERFLNDIGGGSGGVISSSPLQR
ncbi:MAG: hypothetical protein WBL61_19845 [Bryobacteraceae bacterium]